jgi:hypothetical protein
MPATNVTLLAFGASPTVVEKPTNNQSIPDTTPGRVVASGTSTPLDVSAFTQLRLDVTIQTDGGKDAAVDVGLESAPLSTGPWSPVTSQRYDNSSAA